MGELVDVTRDGGIARVVMQRKGNNSIAEDLMQELASAFQELGADPSVRVVVLASAYEKYFSVGADLTSLAGVDREAPDATDQQASKLARAATFAVAMIKDAIHRGYDMRLEEALEIEAQNFARAALSTDAAIGIMSFLSKQEPEFTGS